jgi:hypothetical protein
VKFNIVQNIGCYKNLPHLEESRPRDSSRLEGKSNQREETREGEKKLERKIPDPSLFFLAGLSPANSSVFVNPILIYSRSPLSYIACGNTWG